MCQQRRTALCFMHIAAVWIGIAGFVPGFVPRSGVSASCPWLNTTVANGLGIVLPPQTAMISPAPYRVNDTISYHCNSSYFIHVDGRSLGRQQLIVQCTENGNWTEDITLAPQCLSVSCGRPFTTVQASALFAANNSMAPPFPYLSAVALVCREEYHVAGFDFSVKTRVAVCQSTGQWDREDFPGCVLIRCSSPAQLVPNSVMTSGDTAVHGRFPITCMAGYYLDGDVSTGSSTTILCSLQGTWLPRIPVCALPPPTTSAPTSLPSTTSMVTTILVTTDEVDQNSSVTDVTSLSVNSTTSEDNVTITSSSIGITITSRTALPSATATVTSNSAINSSGSGAPLVEDSGLSSGTVIIIAVCSAVLVIFIILLVVFLVRRKGFHKKRWQNLPVVIGSPDQRYNDTMRSHMSLNLRTHTSVANGSSTVIRNNQSQEFDDPIYAGSGSRITTTRSFNGGLNTYGRQQANQVYSSPMSHSSSSRGLPSPPTTLPTPVASVASHDQQQQSASGTTPSNAHPSQQTPSHPAVAEGHIVRPTSDMDAAMALYNQPKSPPLYHELNHNRDDDSPSMNSPYENISSAYADLDEVSPRRPATGAGNVYNSVRQPPQRKSPGYDPSSAVSAAQAVDPSPVYYCLENAHALGSENDGDDDDDGDVMSLANADSDSSFYEVFSNSKQPKPKGAAGNNYAVSWTDPGWGANGQSIASPSALYSKPSKATPSSGVTSIPLSEDEELGRKARWELMKKELDLASSNAASMLQRSRSKSLSAAERRDRRQISVKEMDTASDSKSQEQSKRPKPAFPFPPPPRRDSMAAGRRTIATTPSARRAGNRPRSKSAPRPTGPHDRNRNGKAQGEIISPLIDPNLLELTTDL